MKKRFIYALLALFAVLLPGKMWATAYVVYCEDNNTLYFAEGTVPDVGDTYDGQTVTAVWSGEAVTNSGTTQPWESYRFSITTVKIEESFKTVKPTSCHSWFSMCGGLSSITGLEYLDTSEVTDMGYMFKSCVSLQTLDLSSFNTSKVEHAEYMFYSCVSLEKLIVNPEGWDWTSLVDGGNRMFSYCEKLPGYDDYSEPYGVTLSSTLVTFPTACVVYCEGNQTLYFAAKGTVPSVGDTYDGQTVTAVWSGEDVTNSGNSNPGWYGNRASIMAVKIEESFKTVKPTSCHSWFEGCSSPTSIMGLGYLDTSEVTDMQQMFYGCSSLTTLDLSKFNTSNVTDMQEMFYGCSSLTTLDLSKFNTSNVTDMSGMFQGCSNLSGALDLSHFYTGNVTTMANMFNGDAAITSLDLASFDLSKVTSTIGMFNGCTYLTTIYVGSIWDASHLLAASANMFNGCTNLESENHTTYTATAVSDATHCNDATYAVIDDDMTNGYLTEKYPLVINLYDDRDMSGVLSAYNGQKGTVHVYRDFTANQWTTLCLPFNMTEAQISNIFGSGTEVKTMTGASRSGATISSITFSAATDIEAGKPYIIKPTNSIAKATGFTLTQKYISAATAGSTNAQGVAMRGTLTQTTLNVDNSDAETFYTLADQASVPTVSNLTAVGKTTTVNGLKAYFSKTNATTVSVTIPASGYYAFSSIYDLDFSGIENCKAYIGVCWEVNPSTSMGSLTMTRITDVPAGTGLILNGTPGTYNIPISQSHTIPTSLMVAVPEKRKVYRTENGCTNYALNTSTGQFQLLSVNGNNVGAGKAFLAVPTAQLLAATPSSGGAAPERFHILFVDDLVNFGDGTTNIEEVENAGSESEKPVFYNLQGQRVENPTRGIYIVKGKKVYIQ